MNGFTNTILTLLLGWLRSLFNTIWSLLGSEDGNHFIALFRENWKVIFLVLCVGGFVIDRVIYFIRWRPYYVWGSKRRYRRAHREQTDGFANDESAYTPETYEQPEEDEQTTLYAPPVHYASPSAYASPRQTTRFQPDAPGVPGFAPAAAAGTRQSRYAPQETRAYRAPSPYAHQAETSVETHAYTPYPPDATFAPPAAYPNAVPYNAPPEPYANENRFDDDLSPWVGDEPAAAGYFAPRPAGGQENDAPVPKIHRSQYLKDVQSGFAPPPAPQQLFAPSAQPAETPVHPGLDLETFQQNVGMSESQSDEKKYPEFAPFTATSQPAEDFSPKQRVLGSLAKRARTFVSGEDENDPRTIRDLQNTVDVTNAFHAPVYPRKKMKNEDET